MQTSTYNRAIVYWLSSGALLILAMVVIGGITRLTGSGLSIVEWNLISGTLPPLTEAAWTEAFDKYKMFPEYQKLNYSMTLAGFKQIFFWEYLHRLLGRMIGVVFILPFLYFLLSRQLTKPLFKRLLFILALGMAQGLMGWIMVKSGLVENPHVSHYRLAAHLLLALSLIGLILWTVADLFTNDSLRPRKAGELTGLAKLVLGLILIQITLGAFVAGLKAGFSYNTYPLMEGEFFPAYLKEQLTWLTAMEDGPLMQFSHRWVALLVLPVTGLLWYRVKTEVLSHSIKQLAALLLLTCLLQVGLGIAALLLAVPVWLGVLHQLVAVVLFALAVLVLHQSKAGTITTKNIAGTPLLHLQV